MKFKTNQDNSNYLMVNVKMDLPFLLVADNLNVPTDVYREANEIFSASFDKDGIKKLDLFTFPDEVGILKDSLVGEYLLNNSNHETIINLDEYISYNDIVNAFNIAVYEDNCKMSNKILKLFKERRYGFIDELKKNYCSDVIEYISYNRDFDIYLKKKYDTYVPSEYVVYENDRFVSKYLTDNNKVKVKKYGD